MDPAEAARALAEAPDREQIFTVLLRATCSRVPFAALLSVHRDGFRGRRAIAGPGFDANQVRELSIPRDAVDAFEQAVATRAVYMGPLATGAPAVDEQLKRLGGALPGSVLVLPVVMQERTIALIVGHHGDRPVSLEDVADLAQLVPESGRVLERVLAPRADAAAEKPTPPGARPPSGESVITREGDDLAARRRLLGLLRDRQLWPELADAIRTLLRIGLERGEPDEDEQLELLLELAGIEADHLGRADLAIEALRSAQTINAGDGRIIEGLERLLAAQERWEEVADLLERRAAVAEDHQERVFTLLHLAAVSQERLLDDDRAIETYERVRAWSPGHVLAMQKLAALYRTHGRWAPLAALLVDLASRSDDATARVQALESAAEIYEQQLDDARGAFLVWLTVLRREPRRAGGLEALEHLGAVAAAWQELLPEHEALAAELEPIDAAVAARLWHQLARWKRDHLGQHEAYGDALERAVRLAPDDLDFVDELLELRRAQGPWPLLAPVLSKRAELELEPVRRAALLAELGRVLETRLAEPAEAVSAYERALAHDPDCRAALHGLQRIHQELGAWPQLESVLQRLLELRGEGEPTRAEKAALHLELGTLLLDHLGRPDEATRQLEAVIALEPTHTRALQGLARAHQAAGRTDAYLATVEAELDAAPAATDVQRLAELASAWETAGNLERAAACWQKLLAVDDHHEAAHLGVIRTLRQAGRWAELAGAYRAHLQIAFGMEKRAQIMLDLAEVLESRQGDIDGAIAACQEVLQLRVDPEPALDRLARCYARQGRFSDALATIDRLLERAPDARTKADLHQRMARIHRSRGDEAKARAIFEFALELDPANAAAHEGIARLYADKGDWPNAAAHLQRSGLLQEDRAQAIATLTEAARLYRERLGKLDQAGECLRRIVELDPGNLDATRALADLLANAGQWEALWPHVDRLAAAVDRDQNASLEQRLQACLRAARCAVELGDAANVLRLMDRAVELAPESLPILLERADALRRARAWEPAVKAYASLLMQHAGAMDEPQRANAFSNLAFIHKQLGHVPQTLAYYQKVLELEPRHHDTLRQIAELQVDRGAFDEAAASLRALANSVPAEERSPALEQLGDLAHDKLADPARAAAAYLEALEHDGANRRLLQKLLDVQSESGDWMAAIATIARFLELESEPRRRGKYLLAMAAIRRFQLKDDAAALDDYERALNALLDGGGPLDETARSSALEAFHNLDELAVAQEQWPRQDRAHRVLIHRLPPGDPLLPRLWHSLGEIQRTRLRDYASAVYALETAHTLDPEKSPERVKILAELYALVGKQAPDLADHAARLVEADPDNPDAFRAMARAYHAAGRLDETWCVARALVFRNQATAEEQELYRRYQDQERRKAKGVLDEEAWEQLRASDEDRIISSIFALTWEAPVALRSGPAKSFQLKSKERLKVEDGSRALGKIFQNAARVLNAPLPHVYVQPERSGRLLLASCIQNNALAPTVIVGRDLMTGYRDTEIAFCVAGTLALLRPAWYLRLALPTTDELEAALMAAVRLVQPDIGPRAELAALVDTFSAEMQKRLTPHSLEVLRALASRLDARPDLLRWRNAVDAAARRAGLLVCGELAAAGRMASTEPAIPDAPRATDKVRDLVVFSVSPAYFAVRRKLGITIEPA